MRSHDLFQRAVKVLPGGVNSPVRACKNVGCEPLFISHANAQHIYDVEGREYIDYINSWGPMILGHNHPLIVERCKRPSATVFPSALPVKRRFSWEN